MQPGAELTPGGIKSITGVGFAQKADISCSEIEGKRQKKTTHICTWDTKR